MTRLPRLRILLAIVALSTPIAHSQEPPLRGIDQFFPKTEAEVAALLRSTGIQPIRFGESTKWARELEGESNAWFERWALPPAIKLLKEKPYGERAVDFVNRAWAMLRGEGGDMDAASKLRREGAFEFWGKKITDPQVDYFMARLSASSAISRQVTRQIAGGTVTKLATAHENPDLAAFDLAAMRLAAEYGNLDEKTRSRIWKRLEQLLAQRAFEGQPDAALTYFSFVIEASPESAEDLMKLVSSAGLPEWTTETLLGLCEQKIAWRWRGDEFANEVTAQGWDGFKSHLKLARSHLVKAWELNPKDPHAASFMISNLMGSEPGAPGTPPGETLQLWHFRSIAACGDFYDAYTRLRNALQPKWHGTMAHQLALGYACADAGPDVTEVPRIFEAVVLNYAGDVEDRSRIFRNPTVATRLMRYAEESWKAASPEKRNSRCGRMAVFAWMTGNYPAAANAIGHLNGTFPMIAREYLDSLEVSPGAFAGESILRGGPLRGIYEAAVLARANGHHDDARLLLVSLIFLAPPNALPHVGELLKLADAERELEAGKWVAIAGEGRAWGWVVSEGDVSFNSRGWIRLHGADERLRAFFIGRVSADFAMRGSARLTPWKSGTSSAPATFGIVFDRNALGAGSRARSAFTMEIKPHAPGAGRAVLTSAGKELSKPVIVPLVADNEFEFTRSGREVRFKWNGVETVEELPQQHVPPPNASIGFGWGSQGAGAVTEILRLEVRNLKAAL